MPEETPPLPVALEVEVNRGGEVTIPLRALGKPGRPIRFLIRENPRLGRLSRLVERAVEQTTIVYTHSGQGDEDSFRFAAQGDGTAVSRAAEIRVVVRDRPAALSPIRAQDLGQLWLGDRVTWQIPLFNEGGLPWRAQVHGGPGVHPAQETVTLEPGRSTLLTIEVEPLDVGAFRGVVELRQLEDGGSQTMISLLAEVSNPLIIQPDSLVIEGSILSDTRSGELKFFNSTSETRLILIEGPAELNLPESVDIPARQGLSLLVEADPTYLPGAEVAVLLSSKRWQKRVAVEVKPIPARLVWSEGAQISLGRWPLNQTRPWERELINEGGLTAEVTFKLSEGLQIDTSILTIPARSSATVRGRITPSREGAQVWSVTPQLGDQSFSSLQLKGLVDPAKAMTDLGRSTTPSPSRRPPASSTLTKEDEPIGGDWDRLEPQTGGPSHPLLDLGSELTSEYMNLQNLSGHNFDLRLDDTSPTKAWLSWIPDSEVALAEHGVQYRWVEELEESFQTVWEDVPDLKMELVEGRVLAEVGALERGQQYVLRVVSRNASGGTQNVSLPIRFFALTEGSHSSPNVWWVWPLLLGGLAAALYWWKRRRKVVNEAS